MKLMWSSISMRSPAEKAGFMPPAALVMSAEWQPRYLAMRMGRMTSSGGGCGGGSCQGRGRWGAEAGGARGRVCGVRPGASAAGC